MSVSVFAVTANAIWSPTTMDLADDPSWARWTVRVSVERLVTRTISAFDGSGSEPTGHTTRLYGADGNRDPSPGATTIVVPEAAGEGAVATVEYAKLACASATTLSYVPIIL